MSALRLTAEVARTRTVTKRTFQEEKFLGVEIKTGGSSVRETEEFVIHPNRIKSLRVGECVVIKKYPRADAYVVKVDRDE